MKFCRFLHNGILRYGLLDGDRVRDVTGNIFSEYIISRVSHSLDKIKMLAPVYPGKIVAVGLNYKAHAAELEMAVPAEPILFLKPKSTVIGTGDAIVYPEMSNRVDFEAELAIVIGKRAHKIELKDVRRYILGYTCANDVTARDLQKQDGQWTRAKGFDTFCPLGPVITDEIDPNNVRIRSYLNGKLQQDSVTSDFIFNVDYIVSFISKVMTLNPGDVISTGTPSGIGPMQPGDQIIVDIQGIGSLSNFIVKENRDEV